jgi:UDP-glucose 4-epimerase
VETARQVTGREIPVEIGPRRPGDPARLVASAERARRVLGWRPEFPDLKAIVASAWEWHRRHPDGYGS